MIRFNSYLACGAVAIAVGLSAGLKGGQANVPAYAEGKEDCYELFQRKEFTEGGDTLPYRILYPERFRKDKKYPLFIYLHGMGRRGTDNQKQLEGSAALLLDSINRKKFPCIAIYPQAPADDPFVRIKDDKTGHYVNFGTFGREENIDGYSVEMTRHGTMVIDLLSEIIEAGNVDTSRIYISGSSMGAYAVFCMISQYPDVFAAATAMSGGAELKNIEKWAGKVPVRITHGSKDETIPPYASRRIAECLDESGISDYVYIEYPDSRHDSWVYVQKEPDYLSWFFDRSKM